MDQRAPASHAYGRSSTTDYISLSKNPRRNPPKETIFRVMKCRSLSARSKLYTARQCFVRCSAFKSRLVSVATISRGRNPNRALRKPGTQQYRAPPAIGSFGTADITRDCDRATVAEQHIVGCMRPATGKSVSARYHRESRSVGRARRLTVKGCIE